LATLHKKGFIYYLLASLFVGLLFVCYITGDAVTEQVDGWGWLFFLTSCLSHAALLVLALYLVFFLPWALLRLRRVAVTLFVTAVSLLGAVSFVNMQVYKIYRFHINGFILNMLTGPNPGDIFQFDTALLLQEGALLMGVVAVCVLLWIAAARLSRIWKRKVYIWGIATVTALLLTSNALHVYGAFVVKPSILLTARLVPYYFPLSMSSALEKMGIERHTLDVDGSTAGKGELRYPQQQLTTTADSLQTNIVVILIDSWSKRALTPECMPATWLLAQQEQYYDNHVSSSNGTMYSVFSIFTGLQPYYWPAFQGSHTSPLLIDRLLALGYDCRVYPSATLKSPPFHRVLFQHVPDLRTDTQGRSPYERDCRVAADCIADMASLAKGGKPFFTFLFFDMPHGLTYPADRPQYFKPAWQYADYAALHNDMPAEPFWNLYRNLCHATDSLVGCVVDELKRQQLYDNTLVVLTGDHAQEFNENHKNYWGHSSNFSQYQIAVPLIVHEPGKTARRYTHRTTHYDFVPTLMHDYLGVRNDVSDYSAGRLLNDSTPRLWHFVGNELRYAFLVEGDTILTKEGAGWIEVTDARLSPVKDYHIQPRRFEEAIRNLNRFFK
jgi:membrane-anchored protein YejM (alkaline phosphatase superfamily)